MYFERLSATVRSLRVRLMLWNVAAGVLTALGVLLAVREGVRYTLLDELDQALREDLKEITLYFQPAGQQDWRLLQEELNRKAAGHDYHGWFVQFLGPDGRPTWSSDRAPENLPNLTAAQRSAGSYHVDQYRIRFEPVTEVAGMSAIAVGVNESFIHRDMSRLDRLLLIVATVVVLIAPIGGYLLAGRTTRILARQIETAGRLRPSELTERLPIRGTGDELDALASTINGLLDRIADYLRQRDDYLANAAHELRTPLAAIRSSVEVALSGSRSQVEYRELLDDLIEQCAALENLVNQLLLLAETDAHQAFAAVETVALDKLVVQAVEMFQGVAEFRGIRLTLHSSGPANVAGSRHHLRQVLNNLLDNAVKFTSARFQGPSSKGSPRDDQGRIEVYLSRDDDRAMAVLRVTDNGIGIPADEVPKVFERFYRGDKSRVRQEGHSGTGLGLSVCQAIVAAHHGSIKVASTGAAGTTLTVNLPLIKPADWDRAAGLPPGQAKSPFESAAQRPRTCHGNGNSR
jgi:signal transduction histidine kinase